MANEVNATVRTTGLLGRQRAGSTRAGSVLFVCTGNICRSAFAEACLRHALRDVCEITIMSAGTAALVGHEMDTEMLAEAGRSGIDGSGHTARQLTGRDLKDADAVFIFGPDHLNWIATEYPEYMDRVVALRQASTALDAMPRRIVIPLQTLAADVSAMRPQPQPTDWISDPYRKGPAAAASTAQEISAAIQILQQRTDWRAA